MASIPEIKPSDLVIKLTSEKKVSRKFQERRHRDWNDNYELYRNKVKTNRLTQRQTVNVPLMKETIKTVLSKVDESPMIDWEELSGDELKELIMQQMWNQWAEDVNLEGVDIQDKKTALMYGRPHLKLNLVNEKITLQALDIYDIVVGPMTDPLSLETARHVTHQNIFRPLREILADERYTNEGKRKLRQFMDSAQGVIQSGKNKEEFEKKMERLFSMDVVQRDYELFAEGDPLCNIAEHITYLWDASSKRYVRHVITCADDMVELSNDTLKNAIGIEEYPYITWAEDVETTDYWVDAVADLVRTPNKIVNVYFSQLVENRTLRNMGMFWYDATVQGYAPSTYEPGPGRMLPAPGDPYKTIMPVQVDGMDETLNAIEFIIRLVERGTGATAIEKGVGEKKQITLGEVQTLVGKAMERIVTMAKFYRRSRYELARKWNLMMDANQNKPMTLYKTGPDGKVYPKVVYPSDWKSKAGHRPIVRSSAEQEEEKTKALQRLMAIRGMFPMNPALNRIVQTKALDLAELTPAELREVEEAEKQIQKNMQQQQLIPTQNPAEANQPQQPAQVQQNIDLLTGQGNVAGQ